MPATPYNPVLQAPQSYEVQFGHTAPMSTNYTIRSTPSTTPQPSFQLRNRCQNRVLDFSNVCKICLKGLGDATAFRMEVEERQGEYQASKVYLLIDASTPPQTIAIVCQADRQGVWSSKGATTEPCCLNYVDPMSFAITAPEDFVFKSRMRIKLTGTETKTKDNRKVYLTDCSGNSQAIEGKFHTYNNGELEYFSGALKTVDANAVTITYKICLFFDTYRYRVVGMIHRVTPDGAADVSGGSNTVVFGGESDGNAYSSH